MPIRSHLYTNEHLRDKYLRHTQICYALLDTFRNQDASKVYTLEGKMVQVTGNPGGELRKLTSEELQARWLLLADNVRTHNRRYYKQRNYAQTSNGGMLVQWYHVPKIPEHLPDQLNGFYTSQNNVGRWERQMDRLWMLVEFIRSYPRVSPNGKPCPMEYVMGQLMWNYVYIDVLRQYGTQGYSVKQPEDEGKRPAEWLLVKFIPTAERYLHGTYDPMVAIERYKADLLEKWDKWADLYRKGRKPKNAEPPYPTANRLNTFHRKIVLYLTMKESIALPRISLDNLEAYPQSVQDKVTELITYEDEERFELLQD